MRLSWYADSSVAVFSIWQAKPVHGHVQAAVRRSCQDGRDATIRPPSRTADAVSRHSADPSFTAPSPIAVMTMATARRPATCPRPLTATSQATNPAAVTSLARYESGHGYESGTATNRPRLRVWARLRIRARLRTRAPLRTRARLRTRADLCRWPATDPRVINGAIPITLIIRPRTRAARRAAGWSRLRPARLRPTRLPRHSSQRPGGPGSHQVSGPYQGYADQAGYPKPPVTRRTRNTPNPLAIRTTGPVTRAKAESGPRIG